MDERVIEHIVGRFPRFLATPMALGLSGAGMLTASLLGLGAYALCGHFLFSASLCLVPALFSFYLLVCLFSSIREGKPLSWSTVHSKASPHLASFSLLCGGALLLQLLLALASLLWVTLEHTPILGSFIYLVSSWVPTLLLGLMFLSLLTQILALPTVGVIAARSGTGHDEVISNLLDAWEWGVLVRLKLTLFGLLPLGLLVLATWLFGSERSSFSLEIAALFFRAVVFAALAAPCFLFFVHMVVESDRYILWRTAQKRQK